MVLVNSLTTVLHSLAVLLVHGGVWPVSTERISQGLWRRITIVIWRIAGKTLQVLNWCPFCSQRFLPTAFLKCKVSTIKEVGVCQIILATVCKCGATLVRLSKKHDNHQMATQRAGFAALESDTYSQIVSRTYRSIERRTLV